MVWPPTLEDLKNDLGIAADDTRDDAKLTATLQAAVAYVERVRSDLDFESGVPADVSLGTVRLAGRWHTRRRSPDGLVNMAELGASRVPGVDPDIERLLGIGRYGKPVVA